MAYRLVTCPERGHLEMIEEIEHPLGLLIVACSRFRPACAVDCARTCAARLDRRARATRPDLAAAVTTAVGDDTAVDLSPAAADPFDLDP